jgi:hypothetical protein
MLKLGWTVRMRCRSLFKVSLYRLWSRDREFYNTGIQRLTQDWKKCVGNDRDFVEKSFIIAADVWNFHVYFIFIAITFSENKLLGINIVSPLVHTIQCVRILVRLQVLTTAVMKTTLLWEVGPCSLIEDDLHFRHAYWIHQQGDEYLWNVSYFLPDYEPTQRNKTIFMCES